jgi:spore germination protein GerM
VSGRGRRAVAVVGGLVLAALMGAGCAIPTEGNPVSIAPSKVPFHLLDPHPPTTTTTVPKPSSLVQVKVFFLNADANNQLTSANRYLSTPAALQAVLTDLIAGPSSSEQNSGLTTAIPNDVTVLSAAASAGSVTVNFNSAFGSITGTATEEAVAQVVATVASANGFDTGVIFEIDGVRASVPIANGSQVPGPVYLLQFLSATP